MSGLASAAAVAVVCLFVAGVLHKRRKAPKTVGVLMLLAGFGVSGLVGQLLHRLGAAFGHVAAVGTARLFGVAVPAAVLIAAGVWLFFDLHPKEGKPSKALPVLAFVFPTLLSVLGGVYVGLGGQVLTTIGTGVSELATTVFTTTGGGR
ncbi:hypothetical protein [Carbonactinospora thermoautotrophica]|uniref:hypothetical protein n=1 Tax=Carbonactinospora thermoautotrophica TaxID=1469144 RepID=UPI000A62149A|nr:hypothetical protein [Carbonactinospora thermoautotrophica]